MWIMNSAEIMFDGVIPGIAIDELRENGFGDEEFRFENCLRHSDSTVISSELVIEEVNGDLIDDLNKIADILKRYNIKPLEGEHNRYYGDCDGYDVYTNGKFVAMDDMEYGAYSVTAEEMIARLESLGYTVLLNDVAQHCESD